MRNVILYVAMSLDGYLADTNGSVSWIEGDGTGDADMPWYEEFYNSIDTILMGRVTYEQITKEISPDIWMYGDKKTHVFTSGDEGESRDILFTNRSPSQVISWLKHRKGKDIWLCGGKQLITTCMQENLIDYYHITLIPTLLGGGTPLFSPETCNEKLQLVSCREHSGMVDLIYKKREE